jgi:hypothetical protein
MSVPLLRQLGISPSALMIRIGTFAVLAVSAVTIATARSQTVGVGLLCAAALCAGIVAAVAPDGPWATACVGLLASGYAVSPPSHDTFGEIAGAVSLAMVLWLIHSGYSLASVVPTRARADTSLLVRWISRTGLVLALSVPVAIAAAWLGRRAPAVGWLRVLGVAVLLLAAVSPLVLATRWHRGERS